MVTVHGVVTTIRVCRRVVSRRLPQAMSSRRRSMWVACLRMSPRRISLHSSTSRARNSIRNAESVSDIFNDGSLCVSLLHFAGGTSVHSSSVSRIRLRLLQRRGRRSQDDRTRGLRLQRGQHQCGIGSAQGRPSISSHCPFFGLAAVSRLRWLVSSGREQFPLFSKFLIVTLQYLIFFPGPSPRRQIPSVQ